MIVPKFRCWIPEYGQDREDGADVDGYDGAQAATHFMEHYEARNADYPVASGGSLVVATSQNDEAPALYSVSGESRPTYYARALRAGKENGDADVQ
jgi:hypothetical protein